MIRIISGFYNEIDKGILKQVFRLRYRVYLEEGFLVANKSKIDKDKYDKKAYHVIALDNGKVVGCLRILNRDLACIKIFKKEIRLIKKKKKWKRVVELSRFVIDEDYRINKKQKRNQYNIVVAFELIKQAYKFIFYNKIQGVFVVVNPRHVKRYKKYYRFKQYGKVKPFSDVNNNPAVLMYQNVFFVKLLMRVFKPGFYRFIFSK